MTTWLLEQGVDLQYGAPKPQVWPDALMVCGDRAAHTWRINVTDGGRAANLGGCTAMAYFVRNDGATVPLTCTIAGGTVQATLAQACYVFEGDLTGVMRLSMPQNGLLTLSVLRFRVRKETTDSFVDPEQIIPSLDELLAKISACEAAATAANTATSSANTAASAATSVTAAANAAASAANTAAAGAQAEAKKFSAIAVEVKTLPPSAEATGSAAQTASKTTFSFGIPASNLAYATFKIDSRNHLIMTSPEGFSNIGFAINRKTGHLEVQINA